MSKEYNKLVRDNIPEIIKKEGKTPIVETLNDEQYIKALNEKLQEEVNEYLENNNDEELGDIVEVVLAILKYEGSNLGELIEIMDDKREKRGGFEKRIFLKGVEE